MANIGILGGTFNPIHNGHIQLAKYCQSSLDLDKIIFIPTYTPPHKSSADLADCEHRLNMCKIAVQNYDCFEVSDIEIKRKGKSYTYQTLTSLKEIYPNNKLYLIMGADMFLTLSEWKNPNIILSESVITAIPRSDSDKNDLYDYYDKVLKPMKAEVKILENPVIQVSSTFIRDNIDNYSLIQNLIDRNVYEYIVKNKIYRK